jgi:phosphatidylglycerophosphate synthase
VSRAHVPGDTMANDPLANRRPLASRRLAIMHHLAEGLARAGVTPNAISVAGIGFALIASFALLQAGRPGPLRLTEAAWPACWLVAAVFVQLRLLANLLDGLVAVEGGLGSPLGVLFNEVPDRAEDTMILAAFGVAAGWPILGLWAAVAAVACAYIRQVGGALGQPQSFIGPMAKQHRMAAVTLGCALGFGEAVAGRGIGLPGLVLWVVVLGSLLTISRRLRHIAAGLRA